MTVRPSIDLRNRPTRLDTGGACCFNARQRIAVRGGPILRERGHPVSLSLRLSATRLPAVALNYECPPSQAILAIDG
jgi:hypothetical protein